MDDCYNRNPDLFGDLLYGNDFLLLHEKYACTNVLINNIRIQIGFQLLDIMFIQKTQLENKYGKTRLV